MYRKLYVLGPKCLHGGECQDGVDDFLCSCPPGYSGTYCECIQVKIPNITIFRITSLYMENFPMLPRLKGKYMRVLEIKH
jgi:hypothetical protein